MEKSENMLFVGEQNRRNPEGISCPFPQGKEDGTKESTKLSAPQKKLLCERKREPWKVRKSRQKRREGE